ncbi:Pycsar system effector family protein [Streptomyces sp. NPDC002055]|uniref:Pycsar system effector family protein n=1 Tax=Streptomyces sp. NPDC002055 TaxID=3154534 RepID=UPI00332D4A57
MSRPANTPAGTGRWCRSRPPDGPGNTVAALSRELIAQNQLEIGRADGKAAVLLATSGSLFGLLLMRRPDAASWTLPLWWSALTATAASLLVLLLALVPRRAAALRDGMQVLAYFEDVVRAEKQAGLPAALVRCGGDPRARLERALAGTSRVAHIKNRCVRWAVLLLLPAVTAMVAALAPAA